jgi:hypothetical protein
MDKILRTTINGYGEIIPTAVLFKEGGLLHLWEVNCWSANDLGLGTCLCNNHPMAIEYPISTAEVIENFGANALDGFGEPNEAQIIFDAFGIEAHELEAYLRVSYRLGVNPLPALRKHYNVPIVFGEDPDLLIFPEEEPGTTVFIINSRGEISVREAYEPQPTYEVEADDPVMPELAIPGFE